MLYEMVDDGPDIYAYICGGNPAVPGLAYSMI